MKQIIHYLMSRQQIALLLLMLCLLPLGANAEKGDKPFLCILKTNGEVVKVPITEDSPTIYHSTKTLDNGKDVPCADITTSSGETIDIPLSEIVRFYSVIEKVEAIEDINAISEEYPWQVYTLSGMRVATVTDTKMLPRGVYIVSNGMKTLKIVNP